MDEHLLLNCVETYVQLDPDDEEEFQAMATKHGYRDVLAIYDSGVTWADRREQEATERGLERGLAQGLERGLEQGQLQGQRRLLLRQLELRFGDLPGTTRQWIEGLDSPEELERLAEKVLTAETLDDLGLCF